ncbi:ATP-dependent bile acid permease [Cytospora mali]|uniref:ATP-dependent bile acid permease n=1 Tax=Cytospora mali TaxID=578113 RepID=A0A194V856_CYTMA|nr:ATP-dependent bile acid permease [Valsa mali var. pyri (nom. inval.)]
MTHRDGVEAVVAGVDALLVAILTIPAVIYFVAKTRLYKASGYGSISGFYEDEDGFLSVWADVIAWALILFQSTFLPRRGDYAAKYRLSNFGLVCSVLILASLIYRSRFDDVLHAPGDSKQLAQGICWLLQTISAVAALFALGSIPRRPDVYFKGSLVDQQHTVSLLSMMSFSWNSLVFDISKERQLEMEDLPRLDYQSRSRNLHHLFTSKNTEGRLWWRLLKFHWVQLAQQWCLVFVAAVLALFPQYMMYNLLSGLEQARTPESGISQTLAWALALCLSLALDSIVGSLLNWWTSSRLVIPLGAVLQTLVFDKALKEHETAMPPPRTQEKKDDKDDSNLKESEPGKKGKDAKDAVRQSVINHMKLDSGRVTMFCSYNFYLPLALVKLVLAGGFLVTLLGWKAVVAGLGSAAMVVPLNTWMSKKYAKIQFGLMRYRDGKAHLLTEALQGMRQIKYSALEQHWENMIFKSRNEELAQYWKASLCMVGVMMIMNLGPLLLACVAQSVYAWEQGGNIKASVIFASLGLFDQLDEATALLPLLQVYMMEAWTSCVRLEKYFQQPDKAPVAIPGEGITFDNATVAWPKKENSDQEGTSEQTEARSMLKDVSLQFPEGKLSIIAGKTGSGKSLLLAAILGEVKLISGTVRVPEPPVEKDLDKVRPIPPEEWLIPSLTAFVSQTPWIETGTVRENIIFGFPFVESRYQKVLQACSLEKDVELLIDGDETEVGPKGVTLSGGQRWRVALARALYSRAGIMILDDVLSAVDAHVGRCIVDQALTGELAEGRTRILATHHAEMCLPRANYLVRLHEGGVECAEAVTPTDTIIASTSGSKGSSVHDASETQTMVDTPESQISSEETTVVATENSNGSRKQKKKNREDEEKREKGRVKWKVYKTYLQASRAPFLWLLVAVLIVLSGLAGIARVWSFKKLTEGSSAAEVNNFSATFHRYDSPRIFMQSPQHSMMHADIFPQQIPFHTDADEGHSVAFWIGMSVIFYILIVLFQVGRSLAMTAIGLRTSRVLFERMTHAILRAPLRWVDSVPAGRILNRFTSDAFMVDRRLPPDLGNFFHSIFQLIVTIAASLSVSVYVILAGVALMIVYAQIAAKYINVAREVKRLNSISHSPIYDQFGSVLSGLSTIRAFHRTDFYMDRMFNLIDNSNKASWALSLSGRWMSFRLSMLGTIFVTVVAILAVSGHVDAALAGFSLTFALRYSSRLTGLLSNMTSLELSFNAAERVIEYSEIETEPEDGKDAPAAWPAEGKIEVDNLSVAYKDSLPPVLKNLHFTVKPGERIGIVGRTGAGKSTLASVFFRLLKPREGSVRIDNIDISDLKLTQLRSRLAIIPQDPFLFSGTLKSNLDMDDTKEDYELQTTLQRVHLAKQQPVDTERPSQYPAVSSHEETVISTTEAVTDVTIGEASTSVPIPDVENVDTAPSAAVVATTEADSTDSTGIFNNLSMEISTGGGNLSQGQRQLVCLARALLARPKIVVMDEATSAVDRGTDAAIQTSLRDEFASAGCTVLVIAHRLSTVADFDRILVLEKGRMAEMGTPRELLERGMKRDEERRTRGEVEEGVEDDDGTGAFWDLVQSSAEKEKLIEMVLGGKEAE